MPSLCRTIVGHADLIEPHGLIQDKCLLGIKGGDRIHDHPGVIEVELLRLILSNLLSNAIRHTATGNVELLAAESKSGQVQFRTEKGGIIHCSIGKVSFSVEDLNENLEALIADLIKAKPASAKGPYIKRVSLSSTMGPGVKVERSSLDL